MSSEFYVIGTATSYEGVERIKENLGDDGFGIEMKLEDDNNG